MIFFTVIQWVIDTVGKLGPLSVAGAVYIANKRHNRWTSGAVVRTANLEDQKMRLALLDRRLTVIQHLRSARDKVGPTMKGADALGAVLDALREAELIFEDDEQQAIKSCLHKVLRYQNQFGNVFEHLDREELMEAMEAYSACMTNIGEVLKRLQNASRITALMPLSLPG